MNPRLHLPENVVDAVLDAEISRDGSEVDMVEKMNKWQMVRLKEVIQELQGRMTRRLSSCGQSFRGARTVSGGSLRPGVDSAKSRSRSSVLTAISLPSGRPHLVGLGHAWTQEQEAMRLVVCGVWRAPRLEEPAQCSG